MSRTHILQDLTTNKPVVESKSYGDSHCQEH